MHTGFVTILNKCIGIYMTAKRQRYNIYVHLGSSSGLADPKAEVNYLFMTFK